MCGTLLRNCFFSSLLPAPIFHTQWRLWVTDPIQQLSRGYQKNDDWLLVHISYLSGYMFLMSYYVLFVCFLIAPRMNACMQHIRLFTKMSGRYNVPNNNSWWLHKLGFLLMPVLSSNYMERTHASNNCIVLIECRVSHGDLISIMSHALCPFLSSSPNKTGTNITKKIMHGKQTKKIVWARLKVNFICLKSPAIHISFFFC